MRFSVAVAFTVAVLAVVMPASVAADDCGAISPAWNCCVNGSGCRNHMGYTNALGKVKGLIVAERPNIVSLDLEGPEIAPIAYLWSWRSHPDTAGLDVFLAYNDIPGPLYNKDPYLVQYIARVQNRQARNLETFPWDRKIPTEDKLGMAVQLDLWDFEHEDGQAPLSGRPN
ncbi:hypothetical protein FBU30_010217 [Linnemannia zychae]|nr:hypothetical protein FBU30_010217 [Linnemannia zychae]